MSLYRKKPAVIEAVRWTGDNFDELEKFAGKFVERGQKNGELFVNTLEGTIHAKLGDYIIMDIQGEFYPCDSEIFKKTYEIVEPIGIDDFLTDDYNLYTKPFRDR